MHKGLHVFGPPIPRDVAATSGLVDAVMAHFRKMAPIWSWLMRYVEAAPEARVSQ
jgi:hypothetical protein